MVAELRHPRERSTFNCLVTGLVVLGITLAVFCPVASSDDKTRIRILSVETSPQPYSPFLGDMTLASSVRIERPCELKKNETCILKWMFSIASEGELVRVIRGETEAVGPGRGKGKHDTDKHRRRDHDRKQQRDHNGKYGRNERYFSDRDHDSSRGDDGDSDDDGETRPLDVALAATFDGHTRGGSLLEDGSYSVHLRVRYLRIRRADDHHPDRKQKEKELGSARSERMAFLMDGTPPSILAAASPPPNGAGWNSTDVTVSFDCMDALTGVESCPLPVVLDSEGAAQVVSGTAMDAAGNTATAAVAVSLDRTPPVTSVTAPEDGATLPTPDVTVEGTVVDALSGIALVTCNGVGAAVTATSFSCALTLENGPNAIAVQTTDMAGNVATTTIHANVSSSTGPPTISNLVAPSVVPYTSDVDIAFDYTDPDGDIAFLSVTQSSVLGDEEARIPAAALGIEDVNGQFTLSTAAAGLPFGEIIYTFELEDSAGQLSNEVAVALQIVGEVSGGTPPTLDSFGALEDRWNRPSGSKVRLAPLFSFGFEDPEADILKVLVRRTDPAGTISTQEKTAFALGISGENGTVERSFFELGPNSPLGLYTVELTLIDEGANRGEKKTASFELVASGGRAPLRIDGFVPPEGAAGTEVTLTGEGFDTTSLESNQIELTELPMVVTEVTSSSLTAIIPEHASSGPFVASNRHGRAQSEGLFIVPVGVKVLPEDPAVVLGESLQFLAKVVSSDDTTVSWSVNGVQGGTALDGTIDADGLYEAPASLPLGGVTVAATLAADPSVVGERDVQLLPPPATLGSAAILAAVGGTVHSVDRRASIDVPPGALPSDTEISVRVLRGSELPPAPSPADVVESAVQLGPSGLVFQTPVTLILPLARYYPPGTELPLLYFEPLTGLYQDEGVVTTVVANGDRAAASITHFSIAAILAKLGGEPVINAPHIDGVDPPMGEEGRAIPVLLMGANLISNIDVEVFAGGAPTTDILPGTWTPAGDRAGLLLDIQTIPDLAAGDTRTYDVRLTRRQDGASTMFPFEVLGLDELVVGVNENVSSDRLAKRFSQIDIDGTINVIGERFELESTGPVSITGTIQARGEPGEDASSLGACGGLVASEGVDGCGLAGLTSDGRGGTGRDADDDAEPKHFGADAPRAIGRNGGNPRGTGGTPGENTKISPTDISDLDNLVSKCITEVDDWIEVSPLDCVPVVSTVTNTVGLVTGPYNGSTGKRGFGAAAGSSGGGGGGAGRVAVGLPFLDLPLGFGLGLAVSGGAGGAGGASGDDVTVVSSDAIHLGRRGTLDARGGSGGDGSGLGTAQLFFSVPLVSLFTGDFSINLGVPFFALTGGGGGGGAGGNILLLSGVQVSFAGTISEDSPSNQVKVDGGEGGEGGATLVEPNFGKTITTRVANAQSTGVRGVRHLRDPAQTTITPLFDPDTLDNMVTNQSVLPIRFRKLDTDLQFVRIEGGGVWREVEANLQDGVYHARLVLFQGQNLICVAREPGLPCSSSAMPELVQKRVVSVFRDTDGDGLSDADEIAFRTDPYDPDTDDDGLSDAEEILNGSNPRSGDTDNDGLLDGDEVHLHSTDPNDADSDGDGVKDGVEVILHFDANSAGQTPSEIPIGMMLAAAGADLAIVVPTSGAIGIMGRPNGGLGFGVAFDETSSLWIAKGSLLARHDPLSETTMDIAAFRDAVGNPVSITQIAFDPGILVLYGVEDGPPPDFSLTGQLVRIDRTSGEITRIGAPLSSSIHSLAFTRDGILYATLFDGASERLVELDPVTATITNEIGFISADPVFGTTITRLDPVTGTDTFYASNLLSNDRTDLLELDRSNAATATASMVPRPLFGLTIKSCPAPCLVPVPNSPLPISATDVASANWDNDTTQDLLVVGSGAAPFSVTLSALLGDGSGNFTPGQSVALPDHQLGDGIADSIAVGLLNADMVPDVVFGDHSAPAVYVFFGDGLGGFIPSPDNPIPIQVAFPNTVNDVAVADVRADVFPGAHSDILVTGFGLAGFVGVLEGDGTGSFTEGFGFPGGTGGAINIDVGDVNLDGVLDVANGSFFPGVSINVSDGAVFNQHVIQDPALFGSFEIALGDLDHDGFLDAITMDMEGGQLGIALWDDTTQTFGPVSFFPLGDDPLQAPHPQTIAADDLTGDGIIDVVTGNQSFVSGTTNVIISTGNGSGGFSARRSVPTLGAPVAVELVDVDGDGRLDVVVATDVPNGGIEVFLTRSSF